MHRLGILTLYYGFNEGAVLQAYCLAQHLKSYLPNWKVEIIDQRYSEKVRCYGPPSNSRKRTLSDFIDNTLPLSEVSFLENNHKRAYKFIRKNYDALVFGSDELWKLNYTYTKRWYGLSYEQKDPMCPAFPNAYWPDKNVKIPKIAYAACVGQTDWGKIPKKHHKKMRKSLSDFRLLGIRDQRTISFLEWLDPIIAKKAEMVPDPTFSIDILSLIDKEQLKHKLKKYGVDFSRPRIATVTVDDKDINSAIEGFKKKGYQIIALSSSNKMADIDLSKQGFTPLEWFAVFGFMDACVSMRMHACISCILNDTPFIAVDFFGISKDRDSKINDLMRSFNLTDFYYRPGNDSPDKFQRNWESVLRSSWPIDEIRDKKLSFRNRSKEFAIKIQKLLEE